MSSEIGELFEELREVKGSWRIPKFSSLPIEVGKGYTSPKFTFWGSCWCLTIYFGRKIGSTEWMSVYLKKIDHGSPKCLSLCIDLYYKSQKSVCRTKDRFIFSTTPKSLGWPEFWTMLRLNEIKEQPFPSDEVTINYYLKKYEDIDEVFPCRLLSRLWNLKQSLTGIFTDENADVKLKMQDGEIPAHKAVLKSRSPVFCRMFDAGMSESETGEVNMEDTSVDLFRIVLSYVYRGDPKGLDPDNAMEVYRLAHKYEFEDLRNLCIDVLQDTITTDTVCDVYAFADFFQEVTLKASAIDCFVAVKSEVLKGEKWKKFKRENYQIAFELLEGSLELP